jgi:hypothetical protein
MNYAKKDKQRLKPMFLAKKWIALFFIFSGLFGGLML